MTSSADSSAEFETSPLLREAGFSHAFFSRGGGVSEGAYSSLNFSFAVGDEAQRVQENLRRACQALGVAEGRALFLSQVHGREVRILGGEEQFDEVLHTQGDAVVSRAAGLACAVRVADCVPILVGDITSGAVAAIHAGWRGVVAGVVGSAIEELSRLADGEMELVAAIGPHISLAAFEVSADVAHTLASASSAGESMIERNWGPKPHVNLRGIVRAQLRDAGIKEPRIDDVGGCTLGDPSRYFSFRRDGRHSGRHLAAIVPGPGRPPHAVSGVARPRA